MNMSALAYELVFQGVERSEPQALHRLRAALVGDLELTVEEARQVLDGTRYVVRRANSEDELSRLCSILKQAGAKASIVRERAQDEESDLKIADIELPGEEVTNHQVAAGAARRIQQTDELDPLDQITDLFRDLEESCVARSGAEALKSVPKAASANGGVKASSVATEGNQPLRTSTRRAAVFHKKFWQRAVSAPEIVFSIGFSLVLVALTALLYAP